MINQPKDLDQSDVDRDAREMRDDMIEREVERLTGHHDPMPLIDICAMIVDSPEYGGDVDAFMKSDMIMELIHASQSNPDGVFEQIREALTLLFD